MKPLDVYSPWDLQSAEPPPLSRYAYRFLAEGDSWFTISTLNPAKNSNLLFEMAFEQFAVAINCARPGDTLRRMADFHRDPHFFRLLVGRVAHAWDAILLSAGGNDLIDALQVQGADIPRASRLLLEPDERDPARSDAARYFSDEGWQTFSTYLKANLRQIVELRDRGPSKGAPIFLHGYAVPTPRPAGAGFGLGPWLLPAMVGHAVPEDDYEKVAAEAIRRLAALLADCAADATTFPDVFFFDTTAIPIEAAQLHAPGESGDWVNEIHLTWQGCEKLALPWAAFVERTLLARFGQA